MLRNFIPIRKICNKHLLGFDINRLNIPIRDISCLYGNKFSYLNKYGFHKVYSLEIYKLGNKYYQDIMYVRSGVISFPISGGEMQDNKIVQRIEFDTIEELRRAYRIIVDHEDFRGYGHCV